MENIQIDYNEVLKQATNLYLNKRGYLGKTQIESEQVKCVTRILVDQMNIQLGIVQAELERRAIITHGE